MSLYYVRWSLYPINITPAVRSDLTARLLITRLNDLMRYSIHKSISSFVLLQPWSDVKCCHLVCARYR